jgi:c-di-GMP-binding flagellar brake protein YcgR
MAVAELRQHVRVRSESRVILTLPDGCRVRGTVRDLSLGGAYVVQSLEYGPAVPLEAGTPLELFLYHPHQQHAITLDAVVVRVEPGGGPGMALRFLVREEVAEPLVEHVCREAERNNVPKRSLSVPIVMPRPLRSRTKRAVQLAVPIFRIAAVGVLLGLLWVGREWLRTML